MYSVKFQFLHNEVFTSLRDENGMPYDPTLFTITFVNGKLAVVPIKQEPVDVETDQPRSRGRRRHKKSRK